MIFSCSIYKKSNSMFMLLAVLSILLICSRQGEDEPQRVAAVDDLERIRISRHKLERYKWILV